MASGQGQFTLIDYNDAASIQAYINSLLPAIQGYNVDGVGAGTPSPVWTGSAQKFTPAIYSAGSASEQIATNPTRISNPKWYETAQGGAKTLIGAGAGTYTVNTRSYIIGAVGVSYRLEITSQPFTATMAGISYTFECDYTDPTTGLVLKALSAIHCSAQVNKGSAVFIIVWAPNGYQMRNSVPTSVIVQCDVYRGGAIDPDGTKDETYAWSVWSGGSWVALNSGNANGITGYATYQMTVPATYVNGTASFKCTMTDADPQTQGVVNAVYSDSISVVDVEDNLAVEVQSSGGDVLRNGLGSTTLTGKLNRNGSEIDAGGTAYNYIWTILNKIGAATFFRSSPAISMTLGAAVTVGNMTSLLVSTNTGLVAGDMVILESGTANEELVTVGTVPDATHFTPAANWGTNGGALGHAISTVAIKVGPKAASTTVNMAGGTALGATTITVASIAGFNANEIIIISGAQAEEEYAVISGAPAGAVITVLKGLKLLHANSATVAKVQGARAGKTCAVTEADITEKGTIYCAVS
jgi:hypothetical protein